MTMPLGRHPNGTWIAADIAERDAIGLREAARPDDLCVIPGNDAIYRALTVPGLDTSTWTEGDWTMNSLTLSGDLDIDAASPMLTLGDGSGSPVFNLQKTAAGTLEQRFRVGTSDSANDKRILLDASELWMFQTHNGASWDTGYFLDNNADFNVTGKLLVANAVAADADTAFDDVIIGDGSATAFGLTFNSLAGSNAGIAWNDGTNDRDAALFYNGGTFTWRINNVSRFLITGAKLAPVAGQSIALGETASEGWNSLALTERADHVGAPTATRGELWLRDDQKLVFTDESGTDNVLAFV